MIGRGRRVIEPFRWEDLTDGLPRRLVRGKHFDPHPTDLQDEAREAAARLGKVPRTIIDKTSPERVVWVQFADAEISEGSPCFCGGSRLRRLNGAYARCESCGSLLIVQPAPEERNAIEETQQPEEQASPEPGEPSSTTQRTNPEKAARAAAKREAIEDPKRHEVQADAAEPEEPSPAKEKRAPEEREATEKTQRPGNQDGAAKPVMPSPKRLRPKPVKAKRPVVSSLEHYSDVHLKQYEAWPRRRRYRGHGVLPDGRPVLLLVDVPIEEGEMLPERLESIDRPHRVASFPIDPFGSAIDLDALDG